jgi:hypothetical protein
MRVKHTRYPFLPCGAIEARGVDHILAAVLRLCKPALRRVVAVLKLRSQCFHDRGAAVGELELTVR